MLNPRFLKFVVATVLVFLGLAYVYSLNPGALFGVINAADVKIQLKGKGTQVKLPGNDYWTEAVNNSPIRQGTQIKTSDNSYAVLIYPSGTQTRLDKNTEITLTTFEPKPQNILIDLTTGRVWSSVVKLLGKEKYQTQSPSAVATVRGTSYIHSVIPGGFDQVIVTQSTVDVGCKNIKSTKRVKQGNMITSDCKIALPDPAKTPQKLIQEVWIQDNLQEDVKQEKELKARGKNKINQIFENENDDQDLNIDDEDDTELNQDLDQENEEENDGLNAKKQKGSETESTATPSATPISSPSATPAAGV